MSGHYSTFGNTPAAGNLYEEASKHPKDLQRVSSVLAAYNTQFNWIVITGVPKKTRLYFLLLHRDHTIGKVLVMKWRNPNLLTFLINVIKTKYLLLVREWKAREVEERKRRKAERKLSHVQN